MIAETNYPSAFLDTMNNILGKEFDAFHKSLQKPAPVSIRLNPFKRVAKFDNEEKIPWCEDGKYLAQRPSFTFDPLFHAGCYYVQEASSMFVEQVWKQINPENKTVRVLDLCAAPGGKSTHLLSLMSKQSLLVSNEVIPERNKILRQNITKWGSVNCIVTQNRPEDFLQFEGFFDIILVDAPCSGEGLFRKDMNAISEWSEKNVSMCSQRQSKILKNIIPSLRQNGFLIYSTCTFEPSENDEQVEQCGLNPMTLNISDFGQIKTKFGYQFYPHRIRGEGFYISVLQKSNLNTPSPTISHKWEVKANSELMQGYIKYPDDFVCLTKNDLRFAIPRLVHAAFSFLQKHLYVKSAGILIGELKGKDFYPSHDLALSNEITDSFSHINLEEKEAISYLKGETPKIKTETRGWSLAKFGGMNLGWMKIMDNRINNYLPKNWRILKYN